MLTIDGAFLAQIGYKQPISFEELITMDAELPTSDQNAFGFLQPLKTTQKPKQRDSAVLAGPRRVPGIHDVAFPRRRRPNYRTYILVGAQKTPRRLTLLQKLDRSMKHLL